MNRKTSILIYVLIISFFACWNITKMIIVVTESMGTQLGYKDVIIRTKKDQEEYWRF